MCGVCVGGGGLCSVYSMMQEEESVSLSSCCVEKTV